MEIGGENMHLIKNEEIWILGYISIDRFNKYGSVSMNRVSTLEDKQPVESRTTPIISDVFDEYFGNSCNVYEKAKEYILLFDDYFDGYNFEVSE